MAGLFSRIKNWISVENLTNEDLNDEINNVISNFNADKIDDYSTNAAQMKVQTSPGAQGSESLAVSTAGELERLRYVIARITGETYWYDAPDANIADLNTAVSGYMPFSRNRITSGRVDANNQPMFLVPDGSALTVRLKCSTTPFICVIDGTTYTFTNDITLSSMTAGFDTALAANQGQLQPPSSTTPNPEIAITTVGGSFTPTWAKIAPESGNLCNLTVTATGVNFIARSNQMIACQFDDGVSQEEFVAYYVDDAGSTTDYFYTGFRACFFNSSDTPGTIVPFVPTAGASLYLRRIVFIFLTTSGTLDPCYTTPVWRGAQPTSPSTGDYWYDLDNDTWKKYNGTSFVAANAIYVGMATNSLTACIGARSADFYKPFSSEGVIRPVTSVGNDEILGLCNGYRLSVYGRMFTIGNNFKWKLSDLDTGSISSGSRYYVYITDEGAPKISLQPPIFRGDLGGYYHRHKPWRCFGSMIATSGSTFGFPMTIDKWAEFPDSLSESDHVLCYAGNGHGATSTKIRKYSTVLYNGVQTVGLSSSIRVEDSALGTRFYITKEGYYHVHTADMRSGGGTLIGISLNASAFATTDVQTLTPVNDRGAGRLFYIEINTANATAVGGLVYLFRGDLIMAHNGGTLPDVGANPSACMFRIERVLLPSQVSK